MRSLIGAVFCVDSIGFCRELVFSCGFLATALKVGRYYRSDASDRKSQNFVDLSGEGNCLHTCGGNLPLFTPFFCAPDDAFAKRKRSSTQNVAAAINNAEEDVDWDNLGSRTVRS